MRFPCDRCGAEYRVADDKVGPGGVRATCRKCGMQMVALPKPAQEHYRATADLGTCTLGRLYVGRDERTVSPHPGNRKAKKRVTILALKRVTDIERARAAVGKTHPHVCGVIAAGDDDLVVLERLDGRTLRAIDKGVSPGAPLPVHVAATIAGAVARALAWAHERGVAHGALDLDDVWVREDGSVKVLGLLVASPQPLPGVKDTQATRDDVFRFGVLLYRLLTGAKALPVEFRASLHQAPSVLANLCTSALLHGVSARTIADSLDVYLSMQGAVADPLATLQLLARGDLAIPAPLGKPPVERVENSRDTVPLPRTDDDAPWCQAGAPSLLSAARHRVDRPDVTQSLGASDARALAALVVKHRWAQVWWLESGETGAAVGPLTFDDIHRRASGGLATARSLVWCEGMSSWRELRHLDAASGARLFEPFALHERARNADLPARIWDYEIVDKLADGGQGVVYLARDPTNGYDVALKSVSLETDGARARFEREVHALLGTQGHPNITQLSRWTIDDDARRGYLAFSFIPGKSLADIIKGERGGLAIARALDLAEQVALGLAKLHERGLIHRDLKPQNVMVRADPGRETAVLIDLGIVKLTNVASASTNLISPQYAAPERFSEAGVVDTRSDLYSLGLLLYEMLTGRHPFPCTDLLQLALAHTSRTPPDPRESRGEVSAELAALVLTLLAKDPADRPRHAMIVVEKLRALRTSLTRTPTRVQTVSRISLTDKLRRALAIDSIP